MASIPSLWSLTIGPVGVMLIGVELTLQFNANSIVSYQLCKKVLKNTIRILGYLFYFVILASNYAQKQMRYVMKYNNSNRDLWILLLVNLIVWPTFFMLDIYGQCPDDMKWALHLFGVLMIGKSALGAFQIVYLK